jgi:hypothetical protein
VQNVIPKKMQPVNGNKDRIDRECLNLGARFSDSERMETGSFHLRACSTLATVETIKLGTWEGL